MPTKKNTSSGSCKIMEMGTTAKNCRNLRWIWEETADGILLDYLFI
jgi:hypothetical protein